MGGRLQPASSAPPPPSLPRGDRVERWTAPAEVRLLRRISLSGGERAVPLLGRDSSGREGIYLLKESWGGVELAGEGQWLGGEAQEAVLGYELSAGPAGPERMAVDCEAASHRRD